MAHYSGPHEKYPGGRDQKTMRLKTRLTKHVQRLDAGGLVPEQPAHSNHRQHYLGAGLRERHLFDRNFWSDSSSDRRLIRRPSQVGQLATCLLSRIAPVAGTAREARSSRCRRNPGLGAVADAVSVGVGIAVVLENPCSAPLYPYSALLRRRYGPQSRLGLRGPARG
jgi:hypothetical protein